ncbi:MAG TPA: bifunctional [glutamine synthetase] adenylyltransferase/[glutamine synthetase]-adenylyl-L-tyrosine phosphorylase [Ferrovibrio sp.]|jgi:glutamate-ammonia-ligase adenylyltransferase|uniref:bifunctional [glutamine synthetase] adenylyltransferase/[glutamine synthetase]-adenylyl-L-tyrosine phosphorylase n=1 Tax=Ferrovibrio sp. TaxID=1917215 RepID=UPI002B4ABE75|nr:bifunctional [glutamine synthetase] adenylyltransferase/[glutamine synthetase]-adenylyl-L-tyrosine phosphorylase [Ferrovibrio sp.]HLT77406.1 bifunctional [glutamine synthetase] adenylyltransferase/[glutamine synthetase]-adenylyl-L-tyrosine phosphorylase [Ferrovibrio sp.]
MSDPAVPSPLPDWRRLPPPFDRDAVGLGFDAWSAVIAELEDRSRARALAGLAAKGNGKALLTALFGNSPYLTQLVLNEPDMVNLLLEYGPNAAVDQAMAALREAARTSAEPADLAAPLRRNKRRIALAIAVADITEFWPLTQITGALSDFAALSVDAAMTVLLREAAARGELELPAPEDDPCRGSGFVALGMGKLGARELNYSSDIDLIMLYDQEVTRYTGRRSALEAFIRMTQQMVRLLSERTEDGYVFRTDLRLRPDPGSTPVVLSMAAAETYYESFGQNWERAAMIKARPVGGDIDAGKGFLQRLTPYVWRKNLDFAAIEDIQSIKRQIHAHKGHARIAVAGHNIKLGRGGIREIEFFAQTQQLISGGRDTRLRPPATCDALRALVATERLDQAACDELIEDYEYLRKVEHRLQMIGDEQTHTLPEDERGLAHLACFLGEADAEAFRQKLRSTLERVKRHYDGLFAEATSLGSESGSLVFTGTDDDPETLKTLSSLGFSDPSEIAAMIRGWHFGRYRAMRSERAREKLTAIMPQLLECFSRTGSPDVAIRRFDHFLSGLPAGVQLFSLLQANPAVLDTLAEVLAAAPQLAETLAQNSARFDSLLEYATHAPVFEAEALDASLKRQLSAARDFQDVLDWTRRWTAEHKLQIGIALLRGTMNGEAAGHALSLIADVVLCELLSHVTKEFEAQHGRIRNAKVALLGFGRLGSRELTLESDLDLVLIFDCPANAGQSSGTRPLTPGLYFARLCQRFINAVTAMTGEGRLYEVDMRLRPSGGAGPIAISFDAFAEYQRSEAWTWEHMALTRARTICGPAAFRGKLEKLRLEVLKQPRDADRLLANVASMRARMAAAQKSPVPLWDLKLQRGGLVDLEFVVQYLLLRHGAGKPAILQSNPRQALAAIAKAKLLDAKTAALLSDAADFYATLLGVTRLAGKDEATDPERWPPALRLRLPKLVGEPDLDAVTARLAATQKAVHEIFQSLIETPAAPHLALADSLSAQQETSGEPS